MSAVAAAPGVSRGATPAAAAAAGGAWLWIVEDGFEPATGALERLLAAAEEPDAPAVLCGLVVDASGAPVERFVPRVGDTDLEALVALAPRRRLPVRWVRGGSVLVRRAAVDAHGLPDERALGPYALAEWSARALGGQVGWLVPDSVAAVRGPVAPAGVRALPCALRAARRARWTPGETARVLGELATGGR
jgi:hypothetical protein